MLCRHCVSYNLKVRGNPAPSKSIGASFSMAFAHFVSLYGNSHISNVFLIFIFVMGICDQLFLAVSGLSCSTQGLCCNMWDFLPVVHGFVAHGLSIEVPRLSSCGARSPARDQIWVPCIGRWTLNHWATRSPWSVIFDVTIVIVPGHHERHPFMSVNLIDRCCARSDWPTNWPFFLSLPSGHLFPKTWRR